MKDLLQRHAPGQGAGTTDWGVLLAMLCVSGASWYWLASANWPTAAGLPTDLCRVKHGVPWEARDFLETAGMWLVMMLAMMMPTVLPWVQALNKTTATQQSSGNSWGIGPWFLAGYFIAWSLFSALASLVQWQLASRSLLTSELLIEDRSLSALVWLAVGIYQWTPLKNSCLKHCESPATFFLSHWRDGLGGATLMGIHHGLYCVGCCWLLMFFMLLVGAMNLYWMALISAYVLMEMYVPQLRWVSKSVGVLACLTAIRLLVLP